MMFQGCRYSGNGMGCPYSLDESSNRSISLIPDFLAERIVSRDSIFVVQLVRPPMIRLIAECAGGLDHLPNELLGDHFAIAQHVSHLSAERLHSAPLLVAEGIRIHSVQSIPFGGAHEGKGDPGAPAGIFDHRITRPHTSGGYGGFDQPLSHAVLHTSGGVRIFKLHKNPPGVRRDDLAKLEY